MLVTMRNQESNKSLSREIFKFYCQKKRRNIHNSMPLSLLGQFLGAEAQ